MRQDLMSGEKCKIPWIMLVDDDVDTVALATYAASTEGIFVSIKKGGFSALSFLHELNYEIDAIIIDLSMPDIDGISLTRQIRQNEDLRSKANPMHVYWFTGWPFDANNPNDPIMLGAKETHVEKIFTKAKDDLTKIIHEVKESVTTCRSEPSGEILGRPGGVV